MLTDVVDLLACPLCAGALRFADGSLRCPHGHSFDIARQGYVNLLAGNAKPGTADTADMVQARSDFLGAGHYAPLTAAIADRCHGTVVDAGAGTGHYLAAAMGACEVGLALDISKFAARRAVRAHSRIGVVVADLWQDLPVRSAVADVVLNVFAPRNGPEFRRVVTGSGTVVVVTPTPGHLASLVQRLGLVSVDARKESRVADSLSGAFTLAEREVLEIPLALTPGEVMTLVGMGPSARHLSPAVLTERIAALGTRIETSASVNVSSYNPVLAS
ncbi:MAG: putative RNA methyltransferase [Streptosporangiaceae bacterium]